jgi:hypothetical protein
MLEVISLIRYPPSNIQPFQCGSSGARTYNYSGFERSSFWCTKAENSLTPDKLAISMVVRNASAFGSRFMIQFTKLQRCMNADDFGNVKLRACNYAKNDQLFVYNPASMQIKNLLAEKCLSTISSGAVVVTNCNTADVGQQWTSSLGKIMQNMDGTVKCVTWDSVALSFVMAPCPSLTNADFIFSIDKLVIQEVSESDPMLVRRAFLTNTKKTTKTTSSLRIVKIDSLKV